ncbi:MAG TPA: ABC transporter substrate-binding protein, partial [Acidimicrobiia bacterium]|nr:ABC transporter substrate-binding protein [Acidimicrobiia bacterium]
NRGNGSGNRPDATGSTATAPGGRTATSAAGGAPGAVTRGRDCPGGDRQDKNSTYSPPCLHFSGDNGGATSKGVTGDTITIAMREPEMFDAGINNQGRITDTAADLKRSLLAFIDYFNRVYQTYGRKVQIVFYKAKTPLLAGAEGGHQEEANADALTVAQQIKAFADLQASAPSFADALARQGVIGYGTSHLSKSWYQAHAPYAWANLPDCTWISEQSIDYVVKRLAQAPAKWAGDPAMRTKPRAIGLVVPDSPWYQECADHAEGLYTAAGYKFARRVNYPLNFNQSSQTATNVVAQMKAAGVTTVMCMCDPLLPYFATPQANQQNYHPEWLVAGFGVTDTDIVGQFYDQAQWSHAFGMGVVGDLKQGYDSESYRAYKAIRTDEPAQLRDVMYYPLVWLFTCLQMAGPNLTPKTFEAGCFSLPARQGELGLMKFGPGDYTAVSDAREIYWDPEGVSPWNNRKGRYISTLGGQRFSGPWPQGEPAFPPPK